MSRASIAHQLPLVTRDDDYDDVPGLEVVKLFGLVDVDVDRHDPHSNRLSPA